MELFSRTNQSKPAMEIKETIGRAMWNIAFSRHFHDRKENGLVNGPM
jgi:hypothetical protein